MPGNQRYRFLGYEVDPIRRTIRRDGDLLLLAPKVIDTLVALLEHAGEVVDKDTLMRTVWPDTNVVESSLTRNISVLRKALAEDGHGAEIIQTVSKRGYRFVPAVTIADSPALGGRTIRSWRAVAAMAMAAAIVGLLAVSSSGRREPGAVLTDADREYLLGRHLWNKVEPIYLERAFHRFQRAAELDPTLALAYAGMADSHLLRLQLGLSDSRTRSLANARAAAARALALDPDLSLPRVSLGYAAAMTDLDMEAARSEFSKAASSGAPVALAAYGDYLTWTGDLSGARDYYTRATRLDPVSPLLGTRAARLEYYARRYPRAIELLTEVIEREPTFSLARYYLALSYGFVGRTDDAIRQLRQTRLNPKVMVTDEAWIRARSGDLSPARRLIAERLPSAEAGERKWTQLLIPAITAGDHTLAIKALEEMWNTREVELLYLQSDPRFDPLRSDVRFQALARRLLEKH